MSEGAYPIRYYNFYLCLIGAGRVFFTNLLTSTFSFAETMEIGIRELGLFIFIAGNYYFYLSTHEQKAVYPWRGLFSFFHGGYLHILF